MAGTLEDSEGLKAFDRNERIKGYVYGRRREADARNRHVRMPQRNSLELLENRKGRGFDGGVWPFSVGKAIFDPALLGEIEDAIYDWDYSKTWQQEAYRQLGIVYRRQFEQAETDALLEARLPKKQVEKRRK